MSKAIYDQSPLASVLIYDLQKVKVPPESGTTAKINHLFLSPLSTFPENVTKIRL